MSASAIAAKAASVLLGSERGRKAIGWVLTAILSPLILLIALLCGLGSGSADHNNAAVDACFYGTSYTDQVPQEFRNHVAHMQTAFSALDRAVDSLNAIAEGGSLDPIRIKATFFALCFGEAAPSQQTAERFIQCFYDLEERTCLVPELDENSEPVLDEEGNTVMTETIYTVAVPHSQDAALAALSVTLGKTITEDDRSNILHIYTRVAGVPESGVYGSAVFERGGGSGGTELDLTGYTDPGRKNAADLATYAVHAWEQGWGYVWGTCGWATAGWTRRAGPSGTTPTGCRTSPPIRCSPPPRLPGPSGPSRRSPASPSGGTDTSAYTLATGRSSRPWGPGTA